MAVTTETIQGGKGPTMNQRLTATASSRWTPHVANIGTKAEPVYQGQSEHYQGGMVTQTEKCAHKHDTAIAASKCAEKLGK